MHTFLLLVKEPNILINEIKIKNDLLLLKINY
jgi:hypothetical protein